MHSLGGSRSRVIVVGIVIAKFLLRGWENCNLEHYFKCCILLFLWEGESQRAMNSFDWCITSKLTQLAEGSRSLQSRRILARHGLWRRNIRLPS